jgi:CRP/FNR family transcriptional regulator
VKEVTSIPLQLQPLIKQAQLRHYPRGQIILYEGENPADAFIVKSGAVKIYDIDEDGNEKIIHIIKSPGIFPVIFMFGTSGQTSTFYTTVADSEIYILPRSTFEDQLLKNPALVLYCMKWFANEVQEIMRRMSSLEKTSTRTKLFATLSYLARNHASEPNGGWQQVSFPISHQLLADMIGVTRESTTMVMKGLHNEKIVRSPKLGTLEINSLLINND